MKTSKILTYAVVLWTLVESRHAGRLGRSLDVEGKGSNLTQKQQQEVIHADVLQHFTTTPTAPLKNSVANTDTVQDSTSSFIKDVPFIPEEINVQTLKDDTHLRVSYDRRITIDKQNPNIDSQDETNKTAKSNINDVISYKYNETGPSSSTRSEMLISHSSYEHSSTSVVYDEDDSDHDKADDTHTPEYHPSVSSTTEILNVDAEWKNFDVKKKEKGKKEIYDSVTVPTDYNGAPRIEKPYKDNIISGKLKEKNKDLNSEALDERRSTTRISNSSSISVSEHDSKKPLSSLGILKAGSPGTNNEESVNQSVNSVINSNGVNNDSFKKPKGRYSVKRAQDVANDTEADSSSASGNQLNEDTARDTVPVLNLEPHTTPSIQTITTSTEKVAHSKPYPSSRHSHPTDSTPTKVEIPVRTPSASPTTIVKPSIAFKQQLANKLKGIEPTPTVPINTGDEEADDIQEKLLIKSATKSSLRKKPKPDYYGSSSEMYIPPTATAWTLVSLKSTADSVRNSRKPSLPLDTSSLSPSDDITTFNLRQTATTSVPRVKGFIPWSTRLQKNSSLKPSSTTSSENISSTENAAIDSEVSSSSSNEKIEIKSQPAPPEYSAPTSTTGEQSVIRTTLELDRNMTETSINLIQPSLNDVMVKDQSSTLSQDSVKGIDSSTTEKSSTSSSNSYEEHSLDNPPRSDIQRAAVDKENIIETKQTSEENDPHSKTSEKSQVNVEEKTALSRNSTANEVTSVHIGENVNEIKSDNINQNINLVLTSTTTTLAPEDFDNTKIKKNNDAGDLDPGTADLLGYGAEEGKSGEESEEEYKPKQTTTLPPIFEPFETTVIPELDEDIESENDRDDEEIPSVSADKSIVNQTAKEKPHKMNETSFEIKSTSLLPAHQEANSTGTFVTSFDIVSNENRTQVVTKTPLGGDINWYSIDTKTDNASVGETGHKPVYLDITTTAAIETTIEPETTTETSMEETTFTPETTDKVTTMLPTTTSSTTAETSPSTTTVAVTEPTVTLLDGTNFESVEDPSSCVRIVVHVSPRKLCHGKQQLRESIASQLVSEEVSWEQILIISKKLQDCETREQSTEDQLLEVDICFTNKNQEPSPPIRDEFLKLHTKRSNDPSFPIVEVQMIMQPPVTSSGFDNVLAAIILSVIAAICLLLLGILLVIVRKRQGRFNYGQRCTPVSLDDYSLDNISVYNSVRRKGALRASKRSYGNPGFDDPGGPTHPINFAGLANFSSDREALDEEFNQIPMITVKPDELPPGAESKNRYANVIPLPETRVPLNIKEGINPLSEYINANYIKASKGQEKLYIACQAPLQSTVEDFWRMVWQQQTKVILMLTALDENGVEKCAEYLPQLEITDCHRLFGDFQVTLKKHEVREKYLISSLQLKNLETNLWREVTHLWYSSWPSQGVPEDGSAMIAFLIEARSYMRGAQGPTVVHCSPGTGRTGTVIAIDLCIRDFETLRSVDIPKTVYALRRDRAGAVQTKDQYAFIYQVLNLYATKLTGGALDSI